VIGTGIGVWWTHLLALMLAAFLWARHAPPSWGRR
jgi:hypothetical protein